MYNTSELVLHWEQKRPITYDPALHLTEFQLKRSWCNETVINADLSDLRHGAFAGNYSSLSFTVHLTRVVGFYLMDYFLPSMLIVAISWVSFWLQADQAPPRITLGCSTMLTFITLASAQGRQLKLLLRNDPSSIMTVCPQEKLCQRSAISRSLRFGF